MLEKQLKPKVSEQHLKDENVVAWVEGKGKEKEIIWKKASELNKKEYSKLLEGGIVTLGVKRGYLTIEKHDEKVRVPR